MTHAPLKPALIQSIREGNLSWLDTVKQPDLNAINPSDAYLAWIEAKQDNAIDDPAFKDGLDQIYQYFGAPPINNDAVCASLLNLNSEVGARWAKSHYLPLGHAAYYAWINNSIARLDHIEIEYDTDWVVHPNKSDSYKGALLAIAILGGRPMSAIEHIDSEFERVSGGGLAQGICSVMYRHLANDATSIINPSYEAMAWTSKRCTPRMFKEGADAILMDEECYEALIKPFVAQVKGAQANLDAQSLDHATMPPAKKNSTLRL